MKPVLREECVETVFEWVLFGGNFI